MILLLQAGSAGASENEAGGQWWRPTNGVAGLNARFGVGAPLAYGGEFGLAAEWRPLFLAWGGRVGLSTTEWSRATLSELQSAGQSSLLVMTNSRLRQIAVTSFIRLVAPPAWPIRPYVEGLGSLVRWSAEQQVRFPSGDDAAVVVTDVEWGSLTGWGAGIILPLNEDAKTGITLGAERVFASWARLGNVVIAPAWPQTTVFLGVLAEF